MAVRAAFTLRITAHNYRNSNHMKSNGDCCDNLPLVSCCDCSAGFGLCRPRCVCENLFTFCLLPSNAVRDNNLSNCQLNQNTTPGSYTTREIRNDNFEFASLESTDFPNVENGIMTFHGNGSWPVSCRSRVFLICIYRVHPTWLYLYLHGSYWLCNECISMPTISGTG